MEYKIVFAGPPGAGKTTAIGSISDIAVVGTEAKASDEVARLKLNTTVAMDYGVLNLPHGEKVHLYGTPGQDRFNFMWEILCDRAIGLVMLFDNTRPDPLADLDIYLNAFRSYIVASQGAVVVGITRTEIGRQVDLASFHRKLSTYNLNVAVFEVDARRRDDVASLLLALLAILDPTTKRNKIAQP